SVVHFFRTLLPRSLPMRCRSVRILCAFLAGSAVFGTMLIYWPAVCSGQGPAAGKPPEIRDGLGRPLPWGPEVKGARLSARLVRHTLAYGEPVDLIVQAQGPSSSGLYVRVYWDAPLQTASVEVTTEDGTAVPVRREARGGYSGGQGDYQVQRLHPEG